MKNPYLPIPMRIEKIVLETEDKNIKSFDLSFIRKTDEKDFKYMPGQFAEISVLGKGEVPIGFASSPLEKEFLRFTVNKAGVVTTALHELEEEDTIGIRGPLGNFYPVEVLKGKNVVIIGGGFAFTTLRSLVTYLIHPGIRDGFGRIIVIYGARGPGLLLYKDELAKWGEREDVELYVTVDVGDESWTGKIGYVPTVTKEVAPSSQNAYTIVCGPPIMIKFTFPVLAELGFTPDRIITSLEMRMKCGIGKCGRCNIGSKYVCKDGPIFTLAQLNGLPKEY